MPHSFDPYSVLPSVPAFGLHSTDIADGKSLDVAQCSSLFGDPGEDRSPQLSWEGFPADTQSFAVTCFDPDAPTVSGFWHWAVYDIPASVHELEAGAGAPGGKYLPVGAKMLANDAGGHSFLGAAPRPGTVRTVTSTPSMRWTRPSWMCRRRLPGVAGLPALHPCGGEGHDHPDF